MSGELVTFLGGYQHGQRMYVRRSDDVVMAPGTGRHDSLMMPRPIEYRRHLIADIDGTAFTVFMLEGTKLRDYLL